MKKRFYFLTIVLSTTLIMKAQSLVGGWEFTLDIPDDNTPASIIMNPYLGEDGQLNFHSDLIMKLNMTPALPGNEGMLELTYSANVEGTWLQTGDSLSYHLDESTLTAGYSSIMMPNMENEKANSFITSIQSKLDLLAASLNERMRQLSGSINHSFAITELTSTRLSLTDSSNQPITFIRSDEGTYDPY